jgi:Spy/CpxP family protein refolding chaperone
MTTSSRTGRAAAAVAIVILVFVLGIVIGGVGMHVCDKRQAGPRALTKPSRDDVIQQMTRALDLNSDQQQQLASIIDDTRARWRALYAPLDAQHEAIRQQSRDKIRAILTPEQRTKFEKFMQRVDAERKKHGDN